MHFLSKVTYLSFLVFLSQLAFGQHKLDGTYIRIDGISSDKKVEETIKIKKDSIWLSKRAYESVVSHGETFENSAGTLRYHKKGYKEGSFYSSRLMIMSCDTCPEFWKYTIKSRDSLNVETHTWTMGETDTIIKDGDTSYVTPEIVSVDEPIDLNRVRQLIFTITTGGDILMYNKLYRRKKQKNQ